MQWGAKAFNNMLIVPPGSGIVHQVNLEYLSRLVFVSDKNILYPDTVVGTDSHTTMVNGLGVVGWGVGGIEAEAVMLGQAISMLVPKVVGYKLVGELNAEATATDLVLTITNVSFTQVDQRSPNFGLRELHSVRQYFFKYLEFIDFQLEYFFFSTISIMESSGHCCL